MWFRVSRVRVPLPTPDISGESRSSGSGSLLIESGFYDGVSPSGKARDFDSRIRWFESSHPSQFDPLAQSAEHLPFKQGVPGSIPGWLTKILFYTFKDTAIGVLETVNKIIYHTAEQVQLLHCDNIHFVFRLIVSINALASLRSLTPTQSDVAQLYQ